MNHLFNIFFKSNRFLIIKKNILYSILLKIVSLFLFFAIPKLILLNVNAEHYGLFIFIISLGAIFSLLDLGIGNSLRNKITILKSLNKKKEIVKFITCSNFFLITISLICLLLLIFFWQNLKWGFLINNLSDAPKNINFIINTFIFYSIFSIFLKNINFILLSLHKSYLVDLIDVASKLFFFILLLTFYLLNINIELFLLIKIQIFSFLTIFIFSNFLFYKFSKIKFKIKFFSFSNLLKILNNGFSFFLMQISSLILLFSDKILISKLFISSEITNYFLTSQIYIFLIMFFNFLNIPLWSSFTEAFSKKDFNWIISAIFIEILILFVLILLALTIYNYSYQILNMWVGDKIVFDKSLSFAWMIFVLLRCCNIILTNFLNGAGILKFQVYLSLFTVLLNIPLSIYFAINLGFGPKGILFGSIVCVGFTLIFKIFFTLKSLILIKN